MEDKSIQTKEIQEFIEFVETYVPVSNVKPKKGSRVPPLVIPEFTRDQWEELKSIGDWRAMKKQLDKDIAEFNVSEVSK